MASVYLARRDSDYGLVRMLAVKLIHRHLANDREFIEMFMDEVELASQIRHPNVCAVLDYDLHQDESYLVMEYLIGESLMSVAKRIERAKELDPDRLAACVARMLADACEGLHAAHELTDADGEPLHVVHRDVSLENVFATYDGIAKIMDFGVAAAAHKRHRTLTGVVKGKFASVAPECLKGNKPDRRADIWGIGVVAWELLTGRRLFRRETDVDTLCAVSEAPIARPSEIRPGLPSAIDDIVLRALARDPEQRYATARELGRDFARFCARDGQVVTSADVADWLRELFPGGRERKQQIVALAAQLGTQNDEGTPSHVGETRAPAASATLPPLPPGAEATLATSIWLGPRSASSSPPPATSAPAEHRPGWLRWHSVWRTGWVVFVIASAGAAAALVAQAFVFGPAFAPRSQRALPVLAPAPSDPIASPVAPPSATASDHAREIVLRIRIDPAADAPVLVVESNGAGSTAEAPSASRVHGQADEPRRAPSDSVPRGRH
jgi:serine/threonine-protein kinase